MMEQYYVGTDLKFLINLEAEGFSMDDDDYSIEIRCNNKRVPVSKEDIVTDGDDHYLLIDTSQFSNGLVQAVVYAEVPDEDFPDHNRTEVGVINLCELKKT